MSDRGINTKLLSVNISLGQAGQTQARLSDCCGGKWRCCWVTRMELILSGGHQLWPTLRNYIYLIQTSLGWIVPRQMSCVFWRKYRGLRAEKCAVLVAVVEITTTTSQTNINTKTFVPVCSSVIQDCHHGRSQSDRRVTQLSVLPTAARRNKS